MTTKQMTNEQINEVRALLRSKITDANGFSAMATLRKAAQHEGIAEIEGGAMDDGRVFLHATSEYGFDEGVEIRGTWSVGNAADVRDAMRRLVRCKRDEQGERVRA